MTHAGTTITVLFGTIASLLQFPSPAQAQMRRDAELRPFGASTFGNQRRTLVSGPDRATFSELISTVKGGLQVHVRPGFMLAPAGGIVVKLEHNAATTAFAEMEINHTFRTGGYAGTGIGVWDLGDRAHTAATVLIHFGVPLMMRGPGHARLLFTYESRLFFGQLNNIDDNYQALVGFRYVFR